MNKKFKVLLISGILIIIVFVAIYLFYSNKNYNDTFEIDSENKYIIETSMQWITMQDDGGSHTNIYYNIDLDNNTVSKINENYKANLGGTPETKVNIIYEKEIDAELRKNLNQLLNEVIKKEDDNENKNFNFFVIYALNTEKRIYNENVIEQINNILTKIDNL